MVWAVLIFILSVIPTKSLGPQPVSDKVAHAACYLPLGALAFWAFPRGPRWANWIIAALAASLFGLGLEIIQWFLPWRSFDWFDALANLVGSGVGSTLALLVPSIPSISLLQK